MINNYFILPILQTLPTIETRKAVQKIILFTVTVNFFN